MESEAKSYLASACHTMLRPIIRILLRCGMTFQEFNAHAKAVFVEVCGDEYGIRGRPANASRVAIMTGLSRREIRRQRKRPSLATSAPVRGVDRASRVLAGWHDDPDFVGADGKPLELNETQPEPSFAKLFARYGGDVPMTAMLKELTRSGAVKATSDGRLAARHRYYMPVQTDLVTISRSAQVMEDIGATVYYNLNRSEADPSNFEGRATNLSVPASLVQPFREYLEDRAEEFLDQTDSWLGEHEVDPQQKSTVRLGVGLYFINSKNVEVGESPAPDEVLEGKKK